MMKKILFLGCLLIFFITFSQITNKGKPISWSIPENRQVTKIEVPTIDIQKTIAEDAINDLLPEKPYRIGILSKINYGFEAGVWTNLPNGDRFWRLNIGSKNALNLSVNFDDFYLPKGSNLYLYNNDKSDLLGAYTSINNSKSNILGSWFVKGDNLWIEYFEPSQVNGQGRLQLSAIIHGYRLGTEHQSIAEQQKGLNDSGACNHDVDCSVGADFEDLKDRLKKSVAFLNMGNGFICSGNLINNVNNDKTPYFLTANHCYGTSNPAEYSMRFNWITNGTPRCGSTLNSSNGPVNFLASGSVLRARDTGSDFMLVELNNPINSSWDINYAGWDRTDTNPNFEVGIHHPRGDIMKVCRDDTGAVKGTNSGAQTWQITTAGSGWEIGVTEGGSSGSPLFDQNGRVIGQLFGGAAACSGTNDNGQIDFYGRFAISWVGSSTNSTRLSNWLDPDETGVTTVDMLDQTATINDVLKTNIAIFPNPTTGLLKIDLGKLSGDFTYKVVTILGQVVMTNKLTNSSSEIDLNNLSNNIYFIKITDNTNNTNLVKKIILQK
ncbi:MAG: T9SS type A sorting domain-containing protein [Flavobacteriaceae bacterium]|nr:T9SS type A sorting domain-containing protein [Flavobacteriaceae bacterium]